MHHVGLFAIISMVAVACVTPTGGGGGTTNPPPVAAISATPTSGTVPLDVAFDGSGSTDNGSIASYAWNFGDGDTATTATVNHTYVTAGTFTATLIVTDNQGATDSALVSITVDPVVNNPPVADVAATPISGKEPLLVDFDGTGSTDATGRSSATRGRLVTAPPVPAPPRPTPTRPPASTRPP